MALEQNRYEVRAGQPVPIAAPSDTLNFLLSAKSRSVEIAGAKTSRLVVGPDHSGRMVLAASARIKPGEYTVKVSATSAAGETREASLDVVVDSMVTVPSGSTRNPVVLLNGWEEGFTNSCPISSSSSDTFGNLAQYLVSDGVPVVYLFDNCVEDPDQLIETLGNDLGTFLNSIQYDTGAQVPQIDLVAFSMGGLIARAYLSGLQPDETLTPPSPTLVGKMVLIASPNFGSFMAGNYSVEIPAGSQSAELVPGSALLWNLANWNQRTDDLQGVNAIAVIGNAGTYTPNLSSLTVLSNASDGIVSLASASAGFVTEDAIYTRIVPYCHVDPSAFTNTTFGTFACDAAGIANATSESQETSEIVRSFLAGNSSWQSIGSTPASDPYLSIDGGTLFALVNSAGAYASDLSAVAWGSTQMVGGGDTSTIFYNDFSSGTGVFEATSTSLGTVDCGSYTMPPGYFSAVRCKIDATIFSIGPLISTIPRIVSAGGTITIDGADFGSQCSECKVTATLAGATSSTTLAVTSWKTTAITATLPATLTGFMTITITAATGTDSLAIMAALPATSTIATSLSSLQFSYTLGGNTPAAQSIQLTNSGSGTLDWTATTDATWLSVTPASGTAPSALSVSVSPVGLTAQTYTGTVQIAASGATNTPLVITVTLVVQGTQPAPVINSVVNYASGQSGVASATWTTILGTNLAATTYTWQSSDIVNGALPTSLQGVSVTVNGLPAYIEYVSPTQINILPPDDSTTGPVQVQVTTSQEASNSVTVQKTQFFPAFFTIDNGAYVAAEHADYSLVGSPNLIPGVTTTPAQPGEAILLYGTGFGLTNPAAPTAQLVTAAEPLANPVQVTIGGVAATVLYAGLVEAGTYQINVTVPNLPNGDAAIAATIGGVSTQTGLSITVQQ